MRPCQTASFCVGYRNDSAAVIADSPDMPWYTFSLEDGTPATHPDAREDLADDKAAIEHAEKMAREFVGSTIAMGKSRVVVRDETDKKIGEAPLLNAVR